VATVSARSKPVKYCIGCKNLYYGEPDPGEYSETSGIMFDEAAKLACRRGHWVHEFTSWARIESFERAMEKASGCPDYEERPAHQPKDQPGASQ
jgi:hypothetical protein